MNGKGRWARSKGQILRQKWTRSSEGIENLALLGKWGVAQRRNENPGAGQKCLMRVVFSHTYMLNVGVAMA